MANDYMETRWIEGGVTAPKGYLAAGTRCGLKTEGPDLALIVSRAHSSAAGVFTRNCVKAAPVLLSQRRLAVSGRARAILANAGNANACTGEQGARDAERMTALAAEALPCPPEEVLVASTGIIGHPMPMDRVAAGIPELVLALSESGSANAAEAIMTTDTRRKEVAIEAVANGRAIRIGGIAKGAGMIAPDLATMLCFLTTDAPIRPAPLQRSLELAVAHTFNALTIDSDTSTNDTVFLLANGEAGGEWLDEGSAGLNQFRDALESVCLALTERLARDGEGATKLLRVQVEGASSDADACRVARSIADSPLVKTAAFGRDPNWGRVLMAAGKSGVSFNPARAAVYFNEVQVVADGVAGGFSPEAASAALSEEDVTIRVRVGNGPGRGRVFPRDLRSEYVKINAEYHT